MTRKRHILLTVSNILQMIAILIVVVGILVGSLTAILPVVQSDLDCGGEDICGLVGPPAQAKGIGIIIGSIVFSVGLYAVSKLVLRSTDE